MNNYIDDVAKKKEVLYRSEFLRYAVRAMYAGMYLTLGSAVAFIAANHFSGIDPVIGRAIYALLFPWGLVTIILLNGELATSNMMFLTNATYRKALPARSAVGILLVCTLFNLLGSMAIACMLSRTTLFSNLESTHYMYNAIETKLAKPYGAMFFDGIIANILVNIAIIGSVRIKETSAKILFVVAIIFIFCYFGFEHVIANFGGFSLVMFTNPGVIDSFTFGNVIMHWLLVFVANYIGGGLVMGLGYAWLDSTKTNYLD
ncbi:formate/nitrite transporter family protein [Ruoffia tabacinasalis]|uniref:Formate/nitrite transporter family protein n=1 Tax=Ruoffia tabacinasalis TaxID=87458 RepID=A0ABS0LJA6_9LACT|nr:formate/nitrite transporter family protein [Ruoffia tabacinasalis]MBG9978172.1 formate/nitrite transporter family protein [Ruoffia tabacinasalis]